MKSRAEINELKRNWETDPCWDIEETPGFEKYIDELKNFRLEKEALDRKAEEQDCIKFGVNRDLLRKIVQLEYRISLLERL